MAKEIERAGIPTALICTLVPLAVSVGANRVIAGKAINHPVGDPTLPREEEREFRARLVRRALDALTTSVDDCLVVPL